MSPSSPPAREPAFRNWAGNVAFGAHERVAPRSVEELRGLMATITKARAIGSGHSFSALCDTDGVLVSTEALRAIETTGGGDAVRVGAGARYGDVVRALRVGGRTLSNLASLPHVTVAGAVGTATHGAGHRNQSLASAVVDLEMVTADGSIVRIERGDPLFAASVVGVGALGVVSSLTLATVEEFDIAQWAFEDVPWKEAEASLLDLLALGYSASIFLTWAGDHVEQLWVKTPELSAPVAPGRPASSARHPVPGGDPRHCTEQLGARGPAGERLAHFRFDGVPSIGEELQSEWSVDRAHAREVFAGLRRLGPQIAPVLQVSEIRAVAADNLWLSPFFERESVAFHFTWKPTTAAWSAIGLVEEALGGFAPRPHWGKLFSPEPERLRAVYPRFDDFRALRRKLDPAGKLLNPLLVDLGLE